MLSMTDGQLTNILLMFIGGILTFICKGIRAWAKDVDRQLRDHEGRISIIEATSKH